MNDENTVVLKTVTSIARIAHEVNRAYCQATGDDSQPAWEDAPDWQKRSAIDGAMQQLVYQAEGKELTPEQSHEQWMQHKLEDGWTYGPVKDPERKEHPCMVPYDQLPIFQRAKDYIFRGVCLAMGSGGYGPYYVEPKS